MKRNLILALVMTMILFSACGTGGNTGDDSNISMESAVEADGGIPSGSEEAQVYDMAQNQMPEPGASTKITAVVSKNCNYVYHMLAVSDCGYVNEYGGRYKSLHPQADLQILKQNEQHLTVAGGEHQGELYFLLVALPASLDDDISVQMYFEALADLFATGDVEKNYETYGEIHRQAFSSVAEVNLDSTRQFYADNEPLKGEIAQIAAVMRDNYDIYNDEVWAESYAELSAVAEALNKEFASIDYVGRWEEVLGCTYGQEAFYAVMCNAMENGPNCINVSGDKDVFYHSGEYADTAKLISHEFGIYLLMDILADTDAFQSYDYFQLVESLAEYYNTVVSGGHSDWDWGSEYIDFYRQVQDDTPEITPKELFLRGVEHFIGE